jgi:hypothetical protein
MIDVKAAVRTAVEYAREFQDYLPGRDIRLEETEFDDGDPGFWRITLSFAASLPLVERRAYKEFRINAETGDVVSMKIRPLTDA